MFLISPVLGSLTYVPEGEERDAQGGGLELFSSSSSPSLESFFALLPLPYVKSSLQEENIVSNMHSSSPSSIHNCSISSSLDDEISSPLFIIFKQSSNSTSTSESEIRHKSTKACSCLVRTSVPR